MIAKKKNGFRKIVVNDEIYYWRFNDCIDIRPDQNQSNKLEIDFGYFDHWLFINDKENRPKDFEPKVVTPGFIKKIIENAIQSGWSINDKNKVMKLKYKEGKFECLE